MSDHSDSNHRPSDLDHVKQAPHHLESANEKGHAVALNIVDNPLKRLDREQVVTDVEAFCQTRGLQEYTDLFQKAALVARDPREFDMIPELSSQEKDELLFEREHKFKGSFWLWYSVMMCAVGAAVQGWDQTGSNAANLSFPEEFGIAGTTGSDPWKVGAINSIIYLVGGGIGVWFSDPVNYYLGRRWEIWISAVILFITPIASGLAQSWQGLFAARFVMGIGVGMKNACVAVYASEMAPTRVRGALVMFCKYLLDNLHCPYVSGQLWVTFGIFLGYAANVIVKDVPDIAWRLQLGSAFIPTLPLLVGIFFCPESPRWLMKKNRYPQAFQSFIKLRRTPLIAARDFYYSHVLYEEELKLARGIGFFGRFKELFTVPRIRRATWASGMVMIAQQMCGINIISFYSSTVFVDGGFTQDQALYASLGFGALNFVFSIPALFLIDTFGRRSLLLVGFPMMCIFLLAAGLCFLIDRAQEQLRTGLVALFIYLFTIFYSFTEGPVAFQYSAEVFPTIHREQGMAWAVCVNTFFAGVLGLTFPPMVSAMGQVGAFSFYAGLNALALVGIFLLVPETKQFSLEELDQVFEIDRKTFVRHEFKVWLPYAIKHTLLFQRNLPRPPALIEAIDTVEDRQRKEAKEARKRRA